MAISDTPTPRSTPAPRPSAPAHERRPEQPPESLSEQSGLRLLAWAAEMRAVHARLREALDVARESIENAEPGEAAPGASDLLLYCWGFCAALTGHHRGEDHQLFPRLRRSHPDLGPVLDRLTQDHSMLDHLIAQFDHAVHSGGEPVIVERHLDGIQAVLETHFRYEERMLLDVLETAGDSLTDLDATTAFGPLA